MSIQQIKKELEDLKQRLNSHNSQVECSLSSAKEELKSEISRISGRIRESVEAYTFSEADKDDLFNSILESSNEIIQNTYFQRWIWGF